MTTIILTIAFALILTIMAIIGITTWISNKRKEPKMSQEQEQLIFLGFAALEKRNLQLLNKGK